MAKLTEQEAEVFFVSRSATKWYNAQRSDKQHEVALLGGWYWVLGTEEAGPFRTPSAAWRDVYYRRVLREEPPLMTPADVKRAEREAKKAPPAPKPKRKPKPESPTVVRLRRRYA